MNKKLMFGLAAASSAGLFWACGDGEILEIQQSDKFVEYALIDDSTAVDGYVQRAVVMFCDSAAPGNQAACLQDLQPKHGNGNAAVSSSSAGPTSPYAASSSSATNNQQQQQTPISSGNVPVTSSPSQQNPTSSVNPTPVQPTQSSSSAAPVATDPNAWGTCAANASNNAIQKGKSVQWKVTLDNNKAPGGVSIITQGTFSWTFQDGDPATKSGTGSSFQSVLVKYEKSGVKSASVTVSFNGQSNTMQCTPLNVTGAEVSGCACTPSAKEIDVAANGAVTWTVSGCKSSDPTYAYEWSDGLQGTNAASGILTAKGTYAPTVTVKNSDNGMQVVTCGAVTAIDSNNPDYIIKASEAAGAIKLPAGKTTVSLQASGRNNTVFCNVARTDSPTGALNGTVNGAKLAGADYISTTVAAGTLAPGKTLVFDLDVPATCGIQ